MAAAPAARWPPYILYTLGALAGIVCVCLAQALYWSNRDDLSDPPLSFLRRAGPPSISSRQLILEMSSRMSRLEGMLDRNGELLKAVEKLEGRQADAQQALAERQSGELGKQAAAHREALEGLQGRVADALKAAGDAQGAALEGLQRQVNEAAQAQGVQAGELRSVKALVTHSAVELKHSKKKLAREILLAGDPSEWQQQTFTQHGTYGLVVYSSYRMDSSKFAAISLAGLDLRDKRRLEGGCMWFPPSGPRIQGELKILYMNEHHGLQYEIVVIQCHLASPTPSAGGHLLAVVDNEQFVMFREDDDSAALDPSPNGPYESKLTYCSAPLSGKLNKRAVKEWFDFHRVQGVDRFVLYDAGAVDLELLTPLTPYVVAGMLEIADFRDAISYHVWMLAQGVALMDCLYRHRYTSKWLFYGDLDEYLDVVPPLTLGGVLQEHNDRPWLTFGVVWWTVNHCRRRADGKGDDEAWLIEPMVFHDRERYCFHDKYPDRDFCLDWQGHRKFFLNPRKSEIAEIHRVTVPMEGGVDLNSSEVRHHHYQKIVDANYQLCEHEVGDDESADEQLVRDTYMAELVARVKTCQLGDKQCTAQLPG